MRHKIPRTPEYLERCSLDKMYRTQKSHAKARGIEFLLSFEQWHLIWSVSGKLSQRGRKGHQYCMCRNNDSGPYALGNVDIKTNRQNCIEGSTGRYHTDEVKYRIGTGNRGKPNPFKGIPLAQWGAYTKND